MYNLIVENKYGEKYELTHNERYEIIDIDGIDPPDANINTTHNAGFDGSVYNSSYMTERQITITMAINSPAEENRINLYRYFKSKFPVRLYYKNATRDVYIDGYVKNMPIGIFDKKQKVQIVIQCPRPQFRATNEITQDFISVISMFKFAFAIEAAGIPFSEQEVNLEKSIINYGDVDTGVIIRILATDDVVTPKIYNVDTNEFMIINKTIEAGDEIIINTQQGEKSIILHTGGVDVNIIGYLKQGSTWFSLVPGDNVFTIVADEGVANMEVYFTVTDQYEGV